MVFSDRPNLLDSVSIALRTGSTIGVSTGMSTPPLPPLLAPSTPGSVRARGAGFASPDARAGP